MTEQLLEQNQGRKHDAKFFYSTFQHEVMPEVIHPLSEWIMRKPASAYFTPTMMNKTVCVFNVNQNNILNIFLIRIEPLSHTGSLPRDFIETIIMKFKRLGEDFQMQEDMQLQEPQLNFKDRYD
ncbi:hypothetical protein RFI_40403 [Reticulomyxa filosa]|uniref:Uncharacterized protein n=1 Tax=Reticulomyxa filosa TaxID=46433 RepID=X6L789_RETFI|nr:hypothetical protein RFI_40403 [Reticulomyxa filosa]|eukprot:ETN97128.1 hypothetical protein RFI_40403 [Reticulomyxa filosa]